jgi:serine/threonine protein kinase
MSPEACNGDRVDARSDVYSLGAVLYFLLTGTPPFTAPTAAAVMLAHVSEVPDLPSTRVPVPRDLEIVVMCCLDKDPRARYASARELDAALAGCGDTLATPGERMVAAGARMMSRRSSRPPGAEGESEETTRTLERPSTGIQLK